MVMGNNASRTEIIMKVITSTTNSRALIINFFYLGTYRWSSGAEYSGEFKNGKRNGKGIWKSGQG